MPPTVDCPCGYGKDIPPEESRCHACGADLGPLHRLAGLPARLLADGERLAAERRPEALLPLAMAAACAPGSPPACLALGRFLEAMDPATLAHACYECVLARDPENAEAREAVARLAGRHRARRRHRLTRGMIRRYKIRQTFFAWTIYGLLLGLLLGFALAAIS